MAWRRMDPRGCVGAALLGVLAALALHYRAPDPSADVGRGGEDAFASGLFPRELPPRSAPLRWTRERAQLRFRYLPRGAAVLEVDVAGHRGPVGVAADGVLLGVLEPGAAPARFELADNGRRSRDVELRAATFRAGDGRDLGTQLRRVTLRPAARGAPPAALVAALALAAAVAFGAATAAGFGAAGALSVAGAVAVSLVLALWPAGVARSPYLLAATAMAIVGCLFAAMVTRLADRRWPGTGPVAFGGLLLAVVVQGLAATSPAMVVSDVVFHANNLARVAGGDLWITSRTQHSPPFRFPYGVSFYVVLAPLYRLGLDGVWLVRAGAAAAGVAGSAALLWLLARRGGVQAGLAVAALQLLPVTFDLYSFGNLSNVFSQAVTGVFFAVWAGGRPERWPLGAALLAVAAVGHLSSFVVAAALAAALLAAWRREGPIARWRWLTLGAGLGLAAMYYAAFLPIVAEQLPRLGEGSSGGRGLAAAAAPFVAVFRQWGLPVTLLAAAGLPWPRRDALDRDLSAYWVAGGVLALVALVSPLEVRYLHALGLPLAAAAGQGAVRLWSKGALGRIVVVALAVAQAAIAGRNLAEAVLGRYRL
jgi:hypothetical protein